MAKDENNQTDADNENFGLHPCVKCGGRDFQTLYTRDAPRYESGVAKNVEIVGTDLQLTKKQNWMTNHEKVYMWCAARSLELRSKPRS